MEMTLRSRLSALANSSEYSSFVLCLVVLFFVIFFQKL